MMKTNHVQFFVTHHEGYERVAFKCKAAACFK